MSNNNIIIENDDCFNYLQKMIDNYEQVDCIIIDPPYCNIVKNEWDRQWRSIKDYQEWLDKLGYLLSQVLKKNGSFYIFGDDNNVAYVQVVLDKYFSIVNNMVWHKLNGYPNIVKHNMRSYAPMTERILFYEHHNQLKELIDFMIEEQNTYISKNNMTKNAFYRLVNSVCIKDNGEPTRAMAERFFDHTEWRKPRQRYYEAMQGLGLFSSLDYKQFEDWFNQLRRCWSGGDIDILQYNKVPYVSKDKVAQKPVELIRRLIENSTRVGDTVLDCFLGSGTTAVACQQLNRRCIGVELNKENYENSLKRLQTLTTADFII